MQYRQINGMIQVECGSTRNEALRCIGLGTFLVLYMATAAAIEVFISRLSSS